MDRVKVLEELIEKQAWVEDIGDPLQQFVRSLFTNAGANGKKVKNFLNGTWLGHPLHPVLTDVPVGCWTSTFVLDTAAMLTDTPELQTAADITLATGLAAGYAAAVTGLTDWSDTYGKERSIGLLHGLTMAATLLTYTMALIARLSGARRAGFLLSNTGLGLLTAGAYLGGDEVYDLGYGVNHTAYQQGPSDFVYAMSESDLQPNKPAKADAGGTSVVLVKQGGAIYALNDTCVHAGCSLAGGTVEGRSIICPCHGSQYDLADGSVINGPATRPEPTFAVRVQDGVIEVKQA
ncbi:MAG TPA: Rieske 2Fe-2S domain-containing protein [Chloroflexota bacterium]